MDVRRNRLQRVAGTALFSAVLLLAAACSGNGPSGEEHPRHGETTRERTSAIERTAPPETTTSGLEITEEEPPPGVSTDASRVVLRLEGEEGTRFSGICDVGGQQNVLSGEVPRRYAFDLDGLPLSCRIQKQNGGRATLRVVLLTDDTTRSVQQTNAPGGTIRISYRGS
ncbi:hypothetical protein [Rubrobacter xylanophilus]|uniref:hypothetical protein n=1 Tax=Rubrobacter xylanophilus TaxID=49319 RepID=UPI001C63B9E9|nr:hypothetical protein [Rubrobacter xylanophilus]